MDTKVSSSLIPIDYSNNERPTVLGRDLHAALDINEKYTEWFKRMLEYGFVENVDYNKTINKIGCCVKPRIDHRLTLGMAKEIVMIQKDTIGKKARQYFLNPHNTDDIMFFQQLEQWCKEYQPTPINYCVYVMDFSNKIKIGVSSAFEDRLQHIQNASGEYTIQWGHTEYVPKSQAYKIEKECHKHFNSKRLNGEYFQVDYQQAFSFLNEKFHVKYTGK